MMDFLPKTSSSLNFYSSSQFGTCIQLCYPTQNRANELLQYLENIQNEKRNSTKRLENNSGSNKSLIEMETVKNSNTSTRLQHKKLLTSTNSIYSMELLSLDVKKDDNDSNSGHASRNRSRSTNNSPTFEIIQLQLPDIKDVAKSLLMNDLTPRSGREEKIKLVSKIQIEEFLRSIEKGSTTESFAISGRVNIFPTSTIDEMQKLTTFKDLTLKHLLQFRKFKLKDEEKHLISLSSIPITFWNTTTKVEGFSNGQSEQSLQFKLIDKKEPAPHVALISPNSIPLINYQVNEKLKPQILKARSLLKVVGTNIQLVIQLVMNPKYPHILHDLTVQTTLSTLQNIQIKNVTIHGTGIYNADNKLITWNYGDLNPVEHLKLMLDAVIEPELNGASLELNISHVPLIVKGFYADQLLSNIQISIDGLLDEPISDGVHFSHEISTDIHMRSKLEYRFL